MNTGDTNNVIFIFYKDGYGFCHIPSSPGKHLLEISTWRVVGTFMEQMYSYFLGASPVLKNLDVVWGGSDRFKIVSCAMGKVQVQLWVVARHFEASGVQI
jgi:B9 domain-containing protein 2